MDEIGAVMKLFLKLFLEFLPLGLFFVFTDIYDVYVGTTVLMIATVATTAAVWLIYHKLAWMALITAATGLLSGSLTLYFVDPVFVKLKPTIVSLFFAAILLGGLIVKKPLLKPLIGEDLHLTEEGWRVVTLRWALYFVFIAVLNEGIWRNFSTEFWAGFKALALMPLTIMYALSQVPLLRQHRLPGAPHDGIFEQVADWIEGRRAAKATVPAESSRRVLATERTESRP